MITAPSFLLAIPAGAYLASGLFHLLRIVKRAERAETIATIVAICGAAVHGVILLMRALHDPPLICASVSDAVSLVSFLTVIVFLVGQQFMNIKAVGVITLPICFGAALVAATFPSATTEIPDVLRSPWFFLHVPPALLAYVSFAVACASAAMYLSEMRLLRSKRIQAVLGVLPSLDELESLMYRTASFGFLLLTVGIATGCVWAQTEWGSWWSWSPKQTATLVTWLIFATYLHIRLIRGSRTRSGAWLVVLGFATSIATFFVGSLMSDEFHNFM